MPDKDYRKRPIIFKFTLIEHDGFFETAIFAKEDMMKTYKVTLYDEPIFVGCEGNIMTVIYNGLPFVDDREPFYALI